MEIADFDNLIATPPPFQAESTEGLGPKRVVICFSMKSLKHELSISFSEYFFHGFLENSLAAFERIFEFQSRASSVQGPKAPRRHGTTSPEPRRGPPALPLLTPLIVITSRVAFYNFSSQPRS